MAKSGFAKDILKSFIDRIERLLEEREALSADIREVYAEAKGSGFDTKIMRQVIRLRKLDTADLQEQEAMLDLYKTALDMGRTPLGEYASRAEPPPATPRQEQALLNVIKSANAIIEESGGDIFAITDPNAEIPPFLDRRPAQAVHDSPNR